MKQSTPLDSSWDVAGIINGGYLMARALETMQQATDKPNPASATAHFLRPVRKNCQLDVDTTVLRAGRTVSTLSATGTVNGTPVVSMLSAFVDREGFHGPTFITATPPDIKPLEECIAAPEESKADFRLLQHLDFRMDPRTISYALGAKSKRAITKGWIAFNDTHIPSDYDMCFLADASYPPIFNAGISGGWTPTLELTVHFRGKATGPYVRFVFETTCLRDGILEESGEIWDGATDTLLAQSRQLALAPAAAFS